jgi:hypothetical protein
MAERAALVDEPRDDFGARPPGEEVTRLLLDHGPANPVEGDLRIPPRRLRRRQLLVGEAVLLQDRHRGARVRALIAEHPERSRAPVERLVPASLVLVPELESTGGHLGIDPIGPIDAADDPRLAAGARPGVAGSPGVDQCDLRASTEQLERRPAAERSRPDDDHPGTLSDGTLLLPGRRLLLLRLGLWPVGPVRLVGRERHGKRDGSERSEERAARQRPLARLSRFVRHGGWAKV